MPSFENRYLDLIDNEPDNIDEALKQVNTFVNDDCKVDQIWRYFSQGDEQACDVNVVSNLLYTSLKWNYEIFQQRPLEPVEARTELTHLFEQIKIDKPQVFNGGVVSQRYFCELATYLKLMYAGSLEGAKQRHAIEDKTQSPFEVVEEDIPVLAFDRADEFSNQRLPTLPFACQIVDSSSAKAWTTALKKLNHAEINDLRGEIGNAIDWNKLNDTFLVDFKGSMFWLPRNSIQAAEEQAESGTGSRSDAETTPSVTVEGHRSEGRSKTPSRSLRQESLPVGGMPFVPLPSSNSSKSSNPQPQSPPSLNINQLRQRFLENLEHKTTTPKRKRPAGHRSYHSVGVPSNTDTASIISAQEEVSHILSPHLQSTKPTSTRSSLHNTGVFSQRLYHVIKGAPPTDTEQAMERDYSPMRHNRSFSERSERSGSNPRFAGRRSFSSRKQFHRERIFVNVSEDLGKLTTFFSNYDVSAKDIMSICGQRVEVSKYNSHRQSAQININGQAIWLPSDLAYRVYDSEEIANREPRMSHRSASQGVEREDRSVIGIRQLRNTTKSVERFHDNKRAQLDKTRSLSAGFRSDDGLSGNISVVSSHISAVSSLISPSNMSSSPPSILVNNDQKRARSKSKSPKKTSFNTVDQVIPSPGFYYIQRNRNLLFKKCTIHRLDSRRLLSLMGRRIEVTHINRDGCGAFIHKERTYLIPMTCVTSTRPSATSFSKT